MENREKYDVQLLVNGKKVGLKPFVKSVFYQVVTGLVSTLKRTEAPEEIVVRIWGLHGK